MNDLAVAVMNFMNGSNVGGLIRTAGAADIKEVIVVGRKKWNTGAATGAQSKIKVVPLAWVAIGAKNGRLSIFNPGKGRGSIFSSRAIKLLLKVLMSAKLVWPFLAR